MRHDDDMPFGRFFLERPSRRHMDRRCIPCPTCRAPNALTAKEKAKGYQCSDCADREEGW